MSGGHGQHNFNIVAHGTKVTLSGTEGTATANRAVILDANSAIDAVNTATLSIGTSGSETAITATGAELNILDGVTATAAELNTLDGVWDSITLTSETGASGSVAVQVVFKDAAGTTMTAPVAGTFYISEVATGLTRDPADTGIAVLTNGVIQTTDAAVENGWNYVTTAAGLLGFTITAVTDSYWAVFTKPNGLMEIVGPLIVDA